MGPKIYKDAVHFSSCAFAYHKAVFDDDGLMVDYLFLDVNRSFEEMTGLSKEKILNKLFVKDISKNTDSAKNWVKIYEKVVAEKKTIRFEEYSQEFRKYFSILAYSPQKDHFVTLFLNRTFDKKLQEISKYFIDNVDNHIDHGMICEFACDVSGAEYASFSTYDSHAREFTTVSFSGISSLRAQKILGLSIFETIGKSWKYFPGGSAAEVNEIRLYDTLGELAADVLPSTVPLQVEKVMTIGSVAVATIVNGGNVLGNFILFFKKESELKNIDLFRLFLSQLGLFLEKNRLSAELNTSQKMFYTLAENAPVGFLSSDTKGNITYANRRLLEMMDSPSYNISKKINLMDFVNLKECGFSAKLRESIDNDRIIMFEFNYTSIWGKTNWLRAYITPLKDGGAVTGASIVLDDITEKMQSESDLKEKAYTDPLTKAYNRNALETILPLRLDELKERSLVSCFAIIDVDNFKDINDNYGHRAGDSVLKYLAARVKKELREQDLLVRTGGDEFLVYLHDIRETKNASKFIKRIFDKISGRYRLVDDNNLPYGLDVTCSLGAAFYPNDGESVESLMAGADKALYRVKNSGKADYHILY